MSGAAPPAATTLSTGLVLAGVAALLLVVPLALLMRRDERALPLLAVLALPFRLPVSADGRTVNLLIPLYVVVAAGTLARLVPRVRRALARGAALPAPPRSWRAWLAPRGLQWLLLGSVGLYALQAAYSSDVAKAAENLAFFYIPFALLFFLLLEVRWTQQLLLACLGVAVALAVVFAGIGFVEYHRKTLFLNPKVVAANQYDNYFRVNSLFFDPNIYGRFLALVMVAMTAVVLAAPSGLHFGLSGSSGSASNATSGRTKLIQGGLELFAERPVQGHGAGSFERAYKQHDLGAGAQNATSASHTIPVTVAAEQGVVGLAVYAALLAVALAVLFRGSGRSPPRIAVAACFAALVLHTWTYADFLEDPLTWTLLGIGVALARAEGGERCARTSSAS